MILKCPVCRARASADAWAAEVHVEAVVRIGCELPTEVSDRMLDYLGLFRPVSGVRPMSWRTTRTHAEELKALIDQSGIEWNRGPVQPNDPLAWAAAMDRAMQNPNLDLPLKDHNWLRKVAHGISGEMGRNREMLQIQSERPGRRLKVESNYLKTPICGSCGMQADNIVKGEPCPFCPGIA